VDQYVGELGIDNSTENLLLLMQVDTPHELAGRPHRFPVMTEHPPIWPAQSHPFFTNNEVR